MPFKIEKKESDETTIMSGKYSLKKVKNTFTSKSIQLNILLRIGLFIFYCSDYFYFIFFSI